MAMSCLFIYHCYMTSKDRYIILSTSSHQPRVLRATDALEDAGIPVMVQHVFKDDENDSRYKVMVPDRYSTRASQVIEPHLRGGQRALRVS